VIESSATWIDGSPASSVPLPDRGLDYGDGLFETLLVREGQALFVDLHLQRLECGLHTLGFPHCLPTAREQLLQAAAETGSRGWAWSALRLTVTRGAAQRGYAPPETARPRILISATPMGRDCGEMLPPALLDTAAVRWSAQPLLAGIKHLNRLEQVLAAAGTRAAGTDESIMLDQQGNVVSVVAGNIFALRGGRLATPRLDNCGVAGTRRRLVLERWAPALGIPVEEAELNLEELEAADEVFISNSLFGLRPVAATPCASWTSHDLCSALFERYRQDLR